MLWVHTCVTVKLTRHAVDVMYTANEKYKKFVTLKKGNNVKYLKLLRALYGCIQSDLLWYNKFVNKFSKDGFILNIYDLCVANKTTNGSQCIICWYVDDTKVVSSIIELLENFLVK